ncbi:MAG: hypothetical protein ACI9KN_002249 [Gammaproteobacteria bacterium]|jgi:hypothetical protein
MELESKIEKLTIEERRKMSNAKENEAKNLVANLQLG